MGSRERAERISKHGTNKAMKAIGLFMFDKCGNCVIRLSCLVEGVLKSGGYEQPLQRILDDIAGGCINPKHYKGHGTVAKNVANVIKNECRNCNKFDNCVNNVLVHLSYDNEYKNELIKLQVKKCAQCDRVEDCVMHYLEVFNLKNYTMFLTVFLTRFRECRKNKKQLVSLDLGDGKNAVAPLEIDGDNKV